MSYVEVDIFKKEECTPSTRDKEAAPDSGTRDISSSRRLGTPSDGNYKGFVCPVSVRGLVTGATLGLTGPKKNFPS